MYPIDLVRTVLGLKLAGLNAIVRLSILNVYNELVNYQNSFAMTLRRSAAGAMVGELWQNRILSPSVSLMN